jgi:hypothetical protein
MFESHPVTAGGRRPADKPTPLVSESKRGRRARLGFLGWPTDAAAAHQRGPARESRPSGPPGRTGKKVSCFLLFFHSFLYLFVFQNLFQIEFLNQIK